MKNVLFTLVLMLGLPLAVQAQDVIHLPMDNDTGYQGVHDAEFVAGAIGKSMRLDGYSSCVKTSIDASAMSTSTVSFSMWCAPETYPMMNVSEAENLSTAITGNIDDTAKSGFAFMLSSQGNYSFKLYASGWAVECKADVKMPLYQWNHLVAILVNKNVTLYNNGVKVGTAKCNMAFTPGGNDMYIGKSSTELKSGDFNINTFNGLIDDIDVYNSELSSADLSKSPENVAVLDIPSSRFSDDRLRPVFHGMPAANWTNESHGFTYYNGMYHLFFQKNANGPYMARLHWGHLTSTNLCTWNEEKYALAPDTSYDIKGCWSGSLMMVNDVPNIIYTGVDNAKAVIAQASPNDNGLVEWTKKGIIINGKPSGLSDDFRDPYYFENNGEKYIIVGTAKNGIGACTLHHWDGSSWTNDGMMFYQGTSTSVAGTFWEMPTLTKIGDKWLFTVTPQATGNGVEVLYWIGTINSDGTFSPDVTTPKKLEIDGMSKDGYGLLSPSIMQKDGKTILLGIVPDKLASSENYKLGWAHTYSLPREVSISSDGTLCQKPSSELTALRSNSTYDKADYSLSGKETLIEKAGNQWEVDGTFTVSAYEFGFKFMENGKISYNPTSNKLIVDFSNVDRIKNDAGIFDGIYESELPERLSTGSNCEIHTYFDGSILDIFVNDKWATSIRLFATSTSSTPVEAFAEGTTSIVSMKAWNLHNPTTGIVSANVSNSTVGTDVIYDLCGRQISTPQGICIINNKKYVVK